MILRVGVSQIAVTSCVEDNLHKVLASIQEAESRGVDVVCLPEYCLNPDLDTCIDLSREILLIQQACRRHGVWAVFGSTVEEEGKRQSSVFVVDAQGRVVYRYAKVHLWRNESKIFTAGIRSRAFDIGPCKVGVLCCWDMAFPDFVAGVAKQGAVIVLCPSYQCDYEQDQDALRAIPLVRAFENGIYFVTCDAFSPRTLSESVICHPQGIVQSIRNREGFAHFDIHVEELRRLKAYYGPIA